MDESTIYQIKSIVRNMHAVEYLFSSVPIGKLVHYANASPWGMVETNGISSCTIYIYIIINYRKLTI